MKRILSILFLALVFPVLGSCTADSGEVKDEVPSFEMKAEIIALGDKIEVNVTEAEYASGIYWVITSDETDFLDKNGKKISKDSLKNGDTVLITYNGQVMMSYPPQIVALSVKLEK